MPGIPVFTDEESLERFMSNPMPETVDMMRRLDGDIMILGIGGKMGPTLGLTALKAIREAGVDKNVYGVARFSNKTAREKLERWGVACITCDLLEPEQVAGLPDIKNIVFMAGRKFGQVGSDHLTWALNTIVPANVARAFPDGNFTVFSTGSIYSMWPVESDGPSESDRFSSVGEYANSCLGRERVFEYYSQRNGSTALIYRLNYAIDLRYGVIFEVGKSVFEGRAIDLTMGYANVIWQGDANNIALRCLEHTASPPSILNVTGDKVRIRDVAVRFGEIMGKKPIFEGSEEPKAFLSDNTRMKELLGAPPTTLDNMINWIAQWLEQGGPTLDKPTHYQVKNGQFLDD